MAPPVTDYKPQEAVQGGVPHGGVRVYDHPNISIGTDRIHGLLQGCRAEHQRADAQLERGRGGKALPVL